MPDDLAGSLPEALYTQRVPLGIALAVVLAVLVLLAWRRGWWRAARRHPGRLAAAGLVAALVVVPAFWYLASPLFLSTEVQEAPVTVAVVAPQAAGPATSSPVAPAPSSPPSPAPGATTREGAATPAPVVTESPTPAPWTPADPRRGEFEGTDDFHFGRGTATLSEVAPGEWVLRFDDFAVRNGPDLFVYLSPDPDGYARKAVEVVRLKADRGSFNMAVPPDTDLAKVRSVLIWCKQFSHLFAVATLER